MSKKRLKSRFAYRNVVIGIDETNNSMGLLCKNPHHSSSMLVTGYLGDNSKKDNRYSGSLYEDKCGAFREGLSEEETKEFIGYGKLFLSINPDFFYTTFSGDCCLHGENAVQLRGDMIAVLTYKFILAYKLNPSEVQLVIDQIDGKEFSNEVDRYLKELFSLKRLDIPARFIKGAEFEKIPARKADRAGYWLTALHLLGKNHKWPYRNRRVSTRSLERLCIDIQQ